MKTILVVDDNAICREPMAATLRLHGYHTLEAANGQEALQIARAQIPDLILLDVTMPVMDGLTCAGELRKTPATARIPVLMLTASSERSVIVQAAQLGIAGYLLKTNFSTAELITRVRALIGEPEAAATNQPAESAATAARPSAPGSAREEPSDIAAKTTAPATNSRMSKSEVLQRLTHEVELWSIKPVLEYVIALARSSTSTLEDVATAIRQDQSLTFRVLRLANSSFNARGRGAKNLTEATQLIGLTAVRNTVIAILAIEHFDQATGSGLIPQRFWEHSLATAVLAELIGEAVSNKKPDQLFLAGLLHDIGRMVLSTIYPREYAAVIATADEQGLDLEAIELETFGLSHVDATRHLLGQWNLPPTIVEAASRHELPISELYDVKQDTQGVLVVALANRLAHALVVGSSGNGRLLPYHEFASELGLDLDAIDRIAAAALQKTTDTELFYAAQSRQSFGTSLAVELSKTATTAPRVAVVGPDSPADPFSLFIKQLGWLEPEQPTAAVIFVRSPLDFTRFLPALKKLDAAGHGAIPVIAATAGESMSVPVEWSCGRRVETVSLPCAYSRLIDAIARSGPALAPDEAIATG